MSSSSISTPISPDSNIPLTSLCALCHLSPPKYTCPRCFVHTCSLACVKLHKQRAQCNGVRDPAAYRKRGELMTVEGVDRDFNFIAGVERGLKRGRGEEGMGLMPLGVGRGRGGFAGGTGWKFEEELRMREMKVIRAPEGLSRRKQNTSSWKGGGIMWTVEWLANGRERRLQNVADTKSVGEAFSLCFGRKSLGGKRKRGEDKIEQKGGLGEQGLEASSTTSLGNEENQTPSEGARQKHLDRLHFYLHRPMTSSKLKCLIPVDSNSSWKEILKGRTLLEFPTIYVREEPPSQLSDPFILEQDYLQNHGEDVVVMPSTGNPHVPDEPAPAPAVLDSTKLLEVLRQDLVP